MFLVAGLGNPGEEYALTPHNLGFLVVDRLAERHGIRVNRKDSKALVGVGEIDGQRGDAGQAADVYESQRHVARAADGKALDRRSRDLIVVYDELDLPWGGLRIKPKGSAAGHNGMKSVIRAAWGRARLSRVRLGIHPGHPLRERQGLSAVAVRRAQKKELERLVGRWGRRGSSP